MTVIQGQPAAGRSDVRPVYFDGPAGRLFGIHDAPVGADRGFGIVLCQPVGHEYVWSHRAFRTLAGQLARHGFHVFRFDYTGCGDSAGRFEAARLDGWIDDVVAAVGHLVENVGPPRIALVGLRLGGTLAALAAARRRGIERLVLWHAVERGSTYVEELARVHRGYEEATGHTAQNGTDTGPDDGREVLGFNLSDALLADLEALDLTNGLRRPPARYALVVDGADDGRCLTALRAMGVQVEATDCPDDPDIWRTEPYKMAIPRQAMDKILAWFAQTQS